MLGRFSSKIRSWTYRALRRYAPPETVVALKFRRAASSSRSNTGAAFPERNLVATDRVPGAAVLVLAPHPDDEAIGLGGALSMHAQNGSIVTVLYMTDGRGAYASDTRLVDTRRREARTMAKRDGFRQIFWDVQDTQLRENSETVAALSDVLVRTRPDVIYAPSFFEHQFDHYAANLVLAAALGQVSRPDVSVVGYEVWDNIPFPNYVIDISNHFESKAELLRCYDTPLVVTDFVELCRHRDALHYALYVDSRRRTPEGYAEAFCRFDADGYRTILSDFADALRSGHSPLARRD